MFLEHFIKVVTSVNLRKAPIDGDVIAMLPVGAILEVTDDDVKSGWYKVKTASGTIGYITNSAKYVANTDPAWLKAVRQVVTFGETQLAKPYVFGSSREEGSTFDCSDFVRWIYKKYGYKLDVTSRTQADDGTASTLDDLRSGDLVFFSDKDGIYHVAMYVKIDGKDRLLHTYNTKCNIFNRDLKQVKTGCGGVTFTDFSTGSYWRIRARRQTRRIVQGTRFGK